MKKISFILILIFSLTVNTHGQDSLKIKLKPKSFLYENFHYPNFANLKIDTVKTLPFTHPQKINKTSLLIYGGITLATGIGVHIYQSNAWWRNQNSHFHFENDNKYALQIDKYGHYYGAYLLGHIFSSTLEASNLDLESSYQYGALLSFLFQMYVEIEDGFGPNWGFSPGDAGADLLGSAYFLSQYYFPVLHNFQPRLSYWPTEKVLSGKTNAIIIDDYEGQTFWMSIRVKDLLPKSLAQYWPTFLMLAVGTDARNLDGHGGGQREYFLSFDIDYDVLPLHGEFGQWVKNTLGLFHFPMPGIRLSPGFAGFAIIY